MTEEEILEGNKLILNFILDGKNYRIHQLKKNSYKYFQKADKTQDIWITKSSSIRKGTEPNYYFHCNWNWLMPVVEKIESLSFEDKLVGKIDVVIIKEECDISGVITDISKAYAKTKIEAVYIAVIEFIKWYNEQNK